MTTRYIAAKALYIIAALAFLLAVVGVGVGTLALVPFGLFCMALGMFIA